MTTKLLFICEPSDYTSEDNDITLMYQAAARDPRIDLFHLPTSAVSTHPAINATPVKQGLVHQEFLNLNAQVTTKRPLAEIDVVFCRTKKPFPERYLETLGTWLEHTVFLNNPLNKLEQIEPGFLKKVAGAYTPPMIVTSNVNEAKDFHKAHGTIVAKRAGSSAGLGVFKIWRDGNAYFTDQVIEGCRQFSSFEDAFLYVQQNENTRLELVCYLAKAPMGDKRVVVIDGEIYGAYLRKSASGHWVQNRTTSDAEITRATVSDEEREAIAATVPHYRKRDLNTLGYDFLCGDSGHWKISEINVGNIGGVSRLELLTGKPHRERFLNWMIERARTAP